MNVIKKDKRKEVKVKIHLQHLFFLGATILSAFKLKLSPRSKSIPVARLGLTSARNAPLDMNFLYMILAAFSNN
jgi:hypothetical protein